MKLAPKEKIVFLSALTFIFLVLCYNMFIGPSWEKYNRLKQEITKREKELPEIVRLKDIYLRHKKLLELINQKISKKDKNFAIFSFLEEMAAKVGIRSKITNMKPSDSTVGDLYKESAVELKIEEITLEQLVGYLYKLEESNKLLKIKKIKIKARHDNPQILDVNCIIATYDLLKEKKKG